ncbi:MAG: 2-octaprenyl-6-methoxyphenyl hydroxylase [Dyella sp.]
MITQDSATGDAGLLIVGGGLVGASLAIALDTAGIAATLVESAAPQREQPPSYDERNLALARATVNGLEAIGVWRHAQAKATPIEHIRVSRAGDFGSTRIDAARHGVNALGYTLPARELGAALLRRLDECTRLTRLAPASLVAAHPMPGGWQAKVRQGDSEHWLRTALLVGADGTESLVRRELGIAAERHDYQQTLFVATLTPQRSHAGCAFERFTDDGPLALLPLTEGRCGLVLTVASEQAAAVAALDDAAFLALAQQRFGWRLGKFTRLGKRHSYAIQRVVASPSVGPHAVLVGNAAQTMHPIGAQGFNLGLRDALTLAELVAGAADPGAPELLAAYAQRRAADREGTLAMSHGLASLACLPLGWLGPLRSLALLAYDRIPALQRSLARRGMGFREHAPQAVLERLP